MKFPAGRRCRAAQETGRYFHDIKFQVGRRCRAAQETGRYFHDIIKARIQLNKIQGES
jgi:hypothetical protein